jgi:hypothetical protein
MVANECQDESKNSKCIMFGRKGELLESPAWDQDSNRTAIK